VPERTPQMRQSLERMSGCAVEENVPLARYTTWKVGGPARYLIKIDDSGALCEVLLRLRQSAVRALVLGNGSNVLVSDAGYDGAVLRLRGNLATVGIEGEALVAGAGTSLGSAIACAARASRSGLEFALGIPGTVGGAVMTNAGTFAGSTARVLRRVEAVTLEGTRESFEAFVDAYRQPLVPRDRIVTAATFMLRSSEASDIRQAMDEARAKREGSQPTGAATAGSVFKNPHGDSAGRLLDECGLKGVTVGGASVSRVHANFIVNSGGASGADIRELMKEMASAVRARFDIALEPEVTLIGFEEEL
jgi:UDP-N-acetylmuramate dehydrogenase